MVPIKAGCSGTTAAGWGVAPAGALVTIIHAAQSSSTSASRAGRSTDGAQLGAAPGRNVAVESFDLAGDLDQAEGPVQEKGRQHAAPDQVQPFEPIREVRDGPEDSQASQRPENPAQGRRSIERCRRADLGRLIKRRGGKIRTRQSGNHAMRIDLLCGGRKAASKRSGQRGELKKPEAKREKPEQGQRALEEGHPALEQKASEHRQREQ